MSRYQLVHVHGCTDPELLPEKARSWKGLERMLVTFLKSGEYEEEDALFYLVTDSNGRVHNIFPFVNDFMNEMWKRAGRKPA